MCHRSFNALSCCRLSQWCYKIGACPTLLNTYCSKGCHDGWFRLEEHGAISLAGMTRCMEQVDTRRDIIMWTDNYPQYSIICRSTIAVQRETSYSSAQYNTVSTQYSTVPLNSMKTTEELLSTLHSILQSVPLQYHSQFSIQCPYTVCTAQCPSEVQY